MFFQRHAVGFVQTVSSRISSINWRTVVVTLVLSMLCIGNGQACDEQEIYGVGDGGVGAYDFGDSKDASTQSSTDNVGIYYYNPSTGSAHLVDSYYDPNASSWAYNAGYVEQSDSSFAGPGTQSTGPSTDCSGGSGSCRTPNDDCFSECSNSDLP